MIDKRCLGIGFLREVDLSEIQYSGRFVISKPEGNRWLVLVALSLFTLTFFSKFKFTYVTRYGGVDRKSLVFVFERGR